MSTVCDAWQPVEAKYKLSRACLKLLLEIGFEVDILTKSALILRDFDLLEAYKTPRLGMTITTKDWQGRAIPRCACWFIRLRILPNMLPTAASLSKRWLTLPRQTNLLNKVKFCF